MTFGPRVTLPFGQGSCYLWGKGHATFRPRVRLPLGQRSGYLLADGRVTVSAQDGMLWVSTDWWSCISFGVEDGIQIRFRVTIGGTSAETTGTVHED